MDPRTIVLIIVIVASVISMFLAPMLLGNLYVTIIIEIALAIIIITAIVAIVMSGKPKPELRTSKEKQAPQIASKSPAKIFPPKTFGKASSRIPAPTISKNIEAQYSLQKRESQGPETREPKTYDIIAKDIQEKKKELLEKIFNGNDEIISGINDSQVLKIVDISKESRPTSRLKRESISTSERYIGTRNIEEIIKHLRSKSEPKKFSILLTKNKVNANISLLVRNITDVKPIFPSNLVNAANEEIAIRGGGGIEGAITKGMLNDFFEQRENIAKILKRNKEFNESGTFKPGVILVTNSFKLKSNNIDFIIHARGPNGANKESWDTVIDAYFRAQYVTFNEKSLYKSEGIVIPFLSEGIYSTDDKWRKNVRSALGYSIVEFLNKLSEKDIDRYILFYIVSISADPFKDFLESLILFAEQESFEIRKIESIQRK